MHTGKRILAVLCGVSAGILTATWLLFAVNQEVSQFIWDYVAIQPYW